MSTYTGPSSTVANGTDVNFSIDFPYLDKAFVVVQVAGQLMVEGTDYSISLQTLTFSTPPISGAAVVISRNSGVDDSVYLTSFGTDLGLSPRLLRKMGLQPWHVLQEMNVIIGGLGGNVDLSGALFFVAATGGYDAIGSQIRNVLDPTSEQDVATKSYVDSIAQFGVGGVPQVHLDTTDGAASSYTLTGIPDVIATNLLVFLGGSVQHPGVDYSVTGGAPDSTLTFTDRPAAGLALTVYVHKVVKFIPATSIGTGTVLTSMLADLAVTAAKIADSTITAGKLANGAVGTVQLADGSVVGAKIPDGSIVAAKLAAGALANSVGYPELKTTGFATAPGGSVDQLMFIHRTTGDQQRRALTSADVSDFNAAVNAKKLNQLAAPDATLPMGGQRVSALADPTAAQDAATKNYVDTAVAGAPGARGPFLIAQTVLGSAAATISAEWASSSYVRYEVVIEGVELVSGSGAPEMRFRTQATGLYPAGGSAYAYEFSGDDMSVLGSAVREANPTNDAVVLGPDLATGVTYGVTATILNAKHNKPSVIGDMIADSASRQSAKFRGLASTVGDISGVRFQAGGASLEIGTVLRVYGYTTL